jgi:beta-lactamase class A
VKRGTFLSSAGAALVISRAARADAATVAAKVHRIARTMPGRLGVYARTLAQGGPIVAYEASHRFPTASIIKVLIMTTAYAVDEADPGALSAQITFHSGDLIGGSDFMSHAANGERFTVAQLIAPMIRLSDNTAANLLIDHFGVATINAVGRRAGLERTRLARKFMDFAAIYHHNDNLSTPADMARLLYLIEHGAREGVGTIVSARHCRAMVTIMLGQTDRDGIPAALPAGTPVANKTGQVEGTLNDIAIVEPYGDSPYILAIMTADAYDNAAAYEAIHAVTRATYAVAARSYL